MRYSHVKILVFVGLFSYFSIIFSTPLRLSDLKLGRSGPSGGWEGSVERSGHAGLMSQGQLCEF